MNLAEGGTAGRFSQIRRGVVRRGDHACQGSRFDDSGGLMRVAGRGQPRIVNSFSGLMIFRADIF
ncbi:hypothetical protein [Rhizobium sp. Root482]|uniref:hypothetical protein n=1 Tax=Rhizobium sp. Root482 TaxID=1736543 RepID=UPI0012E348EA|nr:hypothetical protein [Rhizobium sp. Root482]